MNFESTYTWSFKCNEAATPRQKIGNALRQLAERFDGRISLAIDIQGTPPITQQQKVECVLFGLGKIRFAAQETVRAEAQERMLELIRIGNDAAGR